MSPLPLALTGECESPHPDLSTRKRPFRRIFRKKKSQSLVPTSSGSTSPREGTLPSSPKSLLVPHDTVPSIRLDETGCTGKKPKNKHSFSFPLFRAGPAKSKLPKSVSAPLPASEDIRPQVSRELTKSPSMSMLYDAAHQEMAEIVGNYTSLPSDRRSLSVPPSSTIAKSRSTPDLYGHSRRVSIPVSPTMSAFSDFPSSRHPAMLSRATSPNSPLSLSFPSAKYMHLAHNARTGSLSARSRKPIPPILSSDEGCESGSAGTSLFSERFRAGSAMEGMFPRLESRADAAPAVFASPPAASPPARLLAKPEDVRPTTSGTFGRPGTGFRPTTGNTDRPGTGISLRTNRPAPLKLHGRFRRLTDAKDISEFGPNDERRNSANVPVLDFTDQEERQPKEQEDSGFVDSVADDLATSEKAMESVASSPTSINLSLHLPDESLFYNPKESLGSMGEQSDVSILTGFERDFDDYQSRRRGRYLGFLEESASSYDIPAVPVLSVNAAVSLQSGVKASFGPPENDVFENILDETPATFAGAGETDDRNDRSWNTIRARSVSSDDIHGTSASSKFFPPASARSLRHSVSCSGTDTSCYSHLIRDVATQTGVTEHFIGPSSSQLSSVVNRSDCRGDDDHHSLNIRHMNSISTNLTTVDPHAVLSFPPSETVFSSGGSPYLSRHEASYLKHAVADASSKQSLATHTAEVANIALLKEMLQRERVARHRLWCELADERLRVREKTGKVRGVIEKLENENLMLRGRLAKVVSLA
ncbi:MAG: hypothetical protein CYPHOPRED_000371 [Cyphobasidiales sp. Tagirdzhanova-0007]|nr:MAG: hypothetical protein CYPHOPRED_000371 [Cyphobasidiales sp. Tagirdzhanova-0007]